MPKRDRLTRAEIEAILSQRPRRIHGALFSLVFAPIGPKEGPKSACVVSKKIAKKAVDRNRIRRRCYAIVRTTPSLPPIHMLWYAKKEAQKAPFYQYEADIQKLLSMVRA